MSLADEYRRQAAWRDWATVFDALPALQGQTVLDLGCAVGDQAAELTARGARVIGLDLNEELLREARSRGLANAEFRCADLHLPLGLGAAADGIWSSFAAAYFPDLPAALEIWRAALRPGGWIALTEVDDFLGHQPVQERTRSLLEGYSKIAFASGRYDFHMGRKLPGHLERAGFTASKVFALADQELAFAGPAPPEVLAAWRARLDRMKLLRDFCGANFEAAREDFLGCLARPDHRATARVICCLASRRA